MLVSVMSLFWVIGTDVVIVVGSRIDAWCVKQLRSCAITEEYFNSCKDIPPELCFIRSNMLGVGEEEAPRRHSQQAN